MRGTKVALTPTGESLEQFPRLAGMVVDTQPFEGGGGFLEQQPGPLEVALAVPSEVHPGAVDLRVGEERTGAQACVHRIGIIEVALRVFEAAKRGGEHADVAGGGAEADHRGVHRHHVAGAWQSSS